jgi:hypothetical protein
MWQQEIQSGGAMHQEALSPPATLTYMHVAARDQERRCHASRSPQPPSHAHIHACGSERSRAAVPCIKKPSAPQPRSHTCMWQREIQSGGAMHLEALSQRGDRPLAVDSQQGQPLWHLRGHCAVSAWYGHRTSRHPFRVTRIDSECMFYRSLAECYKIPAFFTLSKA